MQWEYEKEFLTNISLYLGNNTR